MIATKKITLKNTATSDEYDEFVQGIVKRQIEYISTDAEVRRYIDSIKHKEGVPLAKPRLIPVAMPVLDRVQTRLMSEYHAAETMYHKHAVLEVCLELDFYDLAIKLEQLIIAMPKKVKKKHLLN